MFCSEYSTVMLVVVWQGEGSNSAERERQIERTAEEEGEGGRDEEDAWGKIEANKADWAR